jgi:hypothetical protein
MEVRFLNVCLNKIVGILFGVAIRTRKPLAIPLAPMMWKLIVGELVNIEDLEEVDCMYVQSLRSIRDIHLSGVAEENFHDVIPLECFEGTSCTGKVLHTSSLSVIFLVFCFQDCTNSSRWSKCTPHVSQQSSVL